MGFLFFQIPLSGYAVKRKQTQIMNTKYRTLAARFGPEIRFALTPVVTAPFRATLNDDLERLKERLLRELFRATPDPELNPLLRRAANEATALAWTTPYPLLVLPVLLEEKADAARSYARHQSGIWKRREELAEAMV